MPITRAATLAMSEDMEDGTPRRASRFKEHTNTTSSIRPPPEELWKDIGIEDLIEQFNEENAQPVSRKSSTNQPSRTSSNASSGTATSNGTGASSAAGQGSEGTYARLQRAFATMFGSVLGKRKAGSTEAEREKELHQQIMDERKRAAEIAYYEAKERGLLPKPQVFVRPSMAARAAARGTPSQADAMPPARTPRTPGTPGLYHTPSKKDLNKQKKLSKRVSDLEFKLASARKELHTVLYNDLPPVPPVPKFGPPTPDVTQSENDDDARTSASETTPKAAAKAVKKRKTTAAHDSDPEYKPMPTDSEGDLDLISGASASEHEDAAASAKRSTRRAKGSSIRKNTKRQSSRLRRKFSRNSLKRDDEPLRVVPDGVHVPAVPSIPSEIEGAASAVQPRAADDGYGGCGDEIF
ncbi:uncharacterized protein SETTUDRAFT_39803 [Exserohilum turcica Et28A]|uniref:Uncharacterized protein n=1 Tax=Exserohilum turcicum (strain 28A) TaxID=671987 RepID=R0K9C8_EXST2|nr:uncharacterized protein SETTUDRAFT_39803 [Exserohilum turcica Et28A]EOA86039.1 hypothetical protein SETTUDRAFT_39803 [Exserohilum turcica Et28A]